MGYIYIIFYIKKRLFLPDDLVDDEHGKEDPVHGCGFPGMVPNRGHMPPDAHAHSTRPHEGSENNIPPPQARKKLQHRVFNKVRQECGQGVVTGRGRETKVDEVLDIGPPRNKMKSIFGGCALDDGHKEVFFKKSKTYPG